MPCLVLVSSCFGFSTKDIPLPCMLMTVSSSSFDWFPHWLWWIFHMWKGLMDIHIHQKVMTCCKLLKTQTKQDQARQDKTRRHPDKNVSPGFEKYCIYVMLLADRSTGYMLIDILWVIHFGPSLHDYLIVGLVCHDHCHHLPSIPVDTLNLIFIGGLNLRFWHNDRIFVFKCPIILLGAHHNITI